MANQNLEDRSEPPELVSHISRYMASVVAIALLVFGLTMVASFRRTPEYESSATLLLRAPKDSSINLETEKELIASAAVAELVTESLDLSSSPEAIRLPLRVESPSETEILVVRYTHTDPVLAQRITQAFADSYLDFRKNEALADRTQAASAIDQELEILNSRLEDINSQLSGAGGSVSTGLQSEANLLHGRILERQLEKLQLSESPRVGEIVQRAGLPSSPSSPNHVISALLGMLAGGILGIAQAVTRGRLSKRIIKPQLAEAILEAPVLAVIPPRGIRGNKGMHPVATLSKRRTDISEAYNMLRANVVALASAQDLQILLVSGVSDDEDGLRAATNLGVSAATAETKTILFSIDLQSRRLARLMQLGKGPGLVEILAGKAPLEGALVPGPVPNLRLLRGGEEPADPSQALGSQTMLKIIADLRRDADLIVIHAPLATTAASIALIPLVDGVLLSISEGAKRDELINARRLITQVSGRIVGAVFERSRQRQFGVSPVPVVKTSEQTDVAEERAPRQPAVPPSPAPAPQSPSTSSPSPPSGVRLIDRYSAEDADKADDDENAWSRLGGEPSPAGENERLRMFPARHDRESELARDSTNAMEDEPEPPARPSDDAWPLPRASGKPGRDDPEFPRGR